jgi:predicted lipoprotein with Yx(FWY)xxD motif
MKYFLPIAVIGAAGMFLAYSYGQDLGGYTNGNGNQYQQQQPTSSPSPSASASASPTTSPSVSPSPSVSSVTLQTTTGTLGTYLTDGNGNSLYAYTADTTGTSNCTGGCATAWPPLSGTATASGGAQSALVGSLTRSDGSTQVSYAGRPLYSFVGDTSPGMTTGEGQAVGSGTFNLVAPDGTLIGSAGPSPSPSASPSSSASPMAGMGGSGTGGSTGY